MCLECTVHLVMGIKTLCDCYMCCFIDECIFKFKDQGFSKVLKTWEGPSKFDGRGGGFSKYIGEYKSLKMAFLTLKDPFISESCIEIKIQLNFSTLSGTGPLRVKI